MTAFVPVKPEAASKALMETPLRVGYDWPLILGFTALEFANNYIDSMIEDYSPAVKAIVGGAGDLSKMHYFEAAMRPTKLPGSS